MLPKALTQLFARAHARFGLEIEVLDAGLTTLYPASETELRRTVDQSVDVRKALQECLATGRSAQVRAGDSVYDCSPLRGTRRRGPALVAIRRSGGDANWSPDFWSEIARTVIESDGVLSDALADERDRARRLLTTLRFLRHLADADDEYEVAQALVQAAAVWFDVDARVYRRDLAGDFVLFASLPGTALDDSAQRLNALWVTDTREPQRVVASAEWGSAAGTDVLIVPLACGGSAPAGLDAVLALVGPLTDDDGAHLSVIGRVAGSRLALFRARRTDRMREQIGALIRAADGAPELLAVRIVRELLAESRGASAALTLNRHGRLRRVVSVGAAAPEVVAAVAAPGEWLFAPDQAVCVMPLAHGVTATLELRAPSDSSFTPDTALAISVGAEMLHSWLRGAEPSLTETAVDFGVGDAVTSAFFRRIEEELQRARRFDLRLSLVLVDLPRQLASGQDAERVQETVRRELRESDVLGRMEGHRVAALLTHTDEQGSHRVVERLRRRLAEAALPLKLAGVSVGHAVFSAECRTAEALVAQAMRDAAPVGVM